MFFLKMKKFSVSLECSVFQTFFFYGPGGFEITRMGLLSGGRYLPRCPVLCRLFL